MKWCNAACFVRQVNGSDGVLWDAIPHFQELTALELTPSTEVLEELKDELLSQTISFKDVQIDPAPFQLVERTSVYKVEEIEGGGGRGEIKEPS